MTQRYGLLRLDPGDAINRGRLGFWPLDEAAGAVGRDLSPWRADGVASGSPTRIVSGQGRALQFSGAQHVTSSRAQELREISIAAWVRMDLNANFNQSILSSMRAVDNGVLFMVDNFSTQLKFWANTTVSNATSSSFTMIQEKWAHVGVSWAADGRTATFYLNGVQIGTGVTGGDVQSPVTGWSIGRYGVPNIWQLSGQLRMVSVWGRVLLPYEFRRLYSDPIAGTLSNLRRRPRFLGIAPITGAGAFTFDAMTVTGAATYTAPATSGVPHGVLRRRGKARQWANVPEPLKPVVALAENYADVDPVAEAVERALANYARMSARASIARRERMIDDMKRLVIAAVERAAEIDDEEALIALL